MDADDPYCSLPDRIKAYASQIIRLYTVLRTKHHFDDAALVIGKQLLRSGTSVAANHREARHSRSLAERLAKFTIILQELEESSLWLELLLEHEYAPSAALHQLLDETNQLLRCLLLLAGCAGRVLIRAGLSQHRAV